MDEGPQPSVIALIVVMVLPALAILAIVILRGGYDADAVPAAFLLGLLFLSPAILVWAALAIFGYTLGRRRSRVRREERFR